jgi:hypothetical protein
MKSLNQLPVDFHLRIQGGFSLRETRAAFPAPIGVTAPEIHIHTSPVAIHATQASQRLEM